MKNIIATFTVDTKKLNTLIECAIENLIEMEANSFHEVDIEACLQSYISALLTYNQTLFKLVIQPSLDGFFYTLLCHLATIMMH